MIFEAIISSSLDRDVIAASKENVVLGQKQMYFFLANPKCGDEERVEETKIHDK